MIAFQQAVRGLIKLSVITLLAMGAAYGQNTTVLRAHVPFEFEARGISIPAGDYQFMLATGSRYLSISSDQIGEKRVRIITTLGGSSIFRDAGLVFDVYEGKHRLSELWIPGKEGVLVSTNPKAHKHDKVIAMVANPAPNLTGKQVFERTCHTCHGPNGQGNAAAKKFFNADIPSLGSTFVQNKSDAELREIISNGSRKMPPVAIGQARVQHLLDSASVEKVIQYVRTLKKQDAS